MKIIVNIARVPSRSIRKVPMKPGIHPPYDYVVFRDKSGDFAFLTRSTMTADVTIEWTDGKSYPVVDVEVSSASHPFYTGRQKVLDSTGRVARFEKRYGSADPDPTAGP